MLKQLVEVSRSHSGALLKLEEQEGSHRAFIHKSNCLTSILEQDRERLVHPNPRGFYECLRKDNIDIL